MIEHKVGGGVGVIALAIQLNESASAKTITTTQNANTTALTFVRIFTLNTGDTMRVSVANLSTNSSIVVDRASINIINGF